MIAAVDSRTSEAGNRSHEIARSRTKRVAYAKRSIRAFDQAL
jgi:hypothetical protein